MTWKRVVWTVALLAGTAMVVTLYRDHLGVVDRGLSGLSFTIPENYAVLDLGEATVAEASRALLDAMESGGPVAAVFTRSGDRIQLLVDGERSAVDQRVAGRAGTVRRIRWPGAVPARLEWGAAHGDLADPDLPPPERRNAYH